MSKTFDSFQKSTIKNAAKAVAHFQAKKDKLEEQIKQLQVQQIDLDTEISSYENAVVTITGGYKPLELCEKVSRGSQNDWVFKYPDTILPPTSENESAEPEPVVEIAVDPLPQEEIEDQEKEEEEQKQPEEDPIDNIFD